MKNFTPRKPYNPPRYKRASKWFIFRVKLISILKLLFKKGKKFQVVFNI